MRTRSRRARPVLSTLIACGRRWPTGSGRPDNRNRKPHRSGIPADDTDFSGKAVKRQFIERAMTQSQVTYDAESHLYRVDGEVWPSVTQVLREHGLIDDRWYTSEAALRGQVVHDCAAILLAGDEIEDSTIDPAVEGYVAALCAWQCRSRGGSDTVQYATRIEEQFCCHDHRYAGRIDLVWDHTLVDFKTGAPAAWHSLQLAAYWHALKPPRLRHCINVYLHDNETYQLRSVDPREHWPAFAAAAGLWWWKMKNRCLAYRLEDDLCKKS